MSANVRASSGPFAFIGQLVGRFFPQDGPEDEYVGDAQHEWNFRMAAALLGLKWWRAATFSALGLFFLCNVIWGATLINFLNIKSAPPPLYAVPVNGKGVPVGPAVTVSSGYTPTEDARIDMLQTYVKDAFLVTIDGKIQHDALDFMTFHTTGDASAYLTRYYTKNKPFEIAKSEDVYNVNITINKVSDNAYIASWDQNVTSFSGEIKSTTHLSKTFWIAQGPRIPQNIMSLYVIRIADAVSTGNNN